MVKKADQQRMLDYIVARLVGSEEKIIPIRKRIFEGLEANIILVGNDGVVLMVDKIYPKNLFQRLHDFSKQGKERVASVVFKDGKTFFRSAAEKNYFKKDNLLSLKNYSSDDMQRMILLRPEEITLANRNFGRVQYFQPGSPRMEEGLETFRFNPVEFDYSHIDSKYRFKPQDTSSRRLHIWDQRTHSTGPLFLDSFLLKGRE